MYHTPSLVSVKACYLYMMQVPDLLVLVSLRLRHTTEYGGKCGCYGNLSSRNKSFTKTEKFEVCKRVFNCWGKAFQFCPAGFAVSTYSLLPISTCSCHSYRYRVEGDLLYHAQAGMNDLLELDDVTCKWPVSGCPDV